MTKDTKQFKESLQEVRNPKDGKLKYRLRKQQEREDFLYMEEELKHLDEGSQTDSNAH